MSGATPMVLDVSVASETIVDPVHRTTLWSSLAHDAALLAGVDGLTDDEAAYQISQAYVTTCGGHPSINTAFACRLYAKVLTEMRASYRAAHLAD